MSAPSWQTARRILCIRLDYLGDVLMTTPAFRALKQSLPGREITLLTSPGGAAAARLVPEVDAVIDYAAPWLKSSAPHPPAADLELIAQLAQRRFDGAVIFTVFSQNPLPAALFCHLAGIPLRLAHCRENPYQLLTDWVRETEPEQGIRHEVRRQLDLVAVAGARTQDERLSLRVPPAAVAQAIALLRAADVDPGRRWVALHPGASAASRRYPAVHWREVARRLSAALRCPLVFTGSANEEALIDGIREGLSDCHSLAGRLDLAQLAALIRLAPLLISNNTGPAHVAAAVGTPVVDLYALTNPQHTPWKVRSRVLFHDVSCRYCYKSVCPQGHQNCLALVPPSAVVAAAFELLEDARAQRADDDDAIPMLPPLPGCPTPSR